MPSARPIDQGRPPPLATAPGPWTQGPSGRDRSHGLFDLETGLVSLSILGALLLNLALCFLNTRVMAISDSHVMLGEMVMLAIAFALAIDRKPGLYLTLGLFISYMLLISALRGSLDLKGFRDIFIPIGFYFMGRRIARAGLADGLVLLSGLIVLAVALFEYLALDTYLDYVNVLGYYIARGTVKPEETFGMTRGLFISGLRPEPRTLLAFLGQHRVSSVFLEPVSAGNFGALLYAWAVFRPDMRGRMGAIAIALVVIVLADARFGLMACVLMTLLMPVGRSLPRIVWLAAPMLMLCAIAAYGLLVGADGGPNDVAGRLRVTAAILTSLDPAVVLGARTTDRFTADSGLAYTLTSLGLFGFLGLWAAFVLAPVRDRRALVFRAMIILYLLLLMLISNSFYSIKTAALMWFLLGTADSIDWSVSRRRGMGSSTIKSWRF